MAFASDDWIRVLKALSWPLNRESAIKEALTAAESDSDRESAILATLEAIEDINTAYNETRTGSQSGLIKADVLEWDISQRTDGFRLQRVEFQQELANLLGLTWERSRQTYTGSFEVSTW